MSDPTRRLLQTCHALIEHTEPAGRLVGLVHHAAAVAMPDGSVVAIVGAGLGNAEEIHAHLGEIVRSNPAIHLKLVAIGGGSEVREAVRRARPWVSMRRAVQAYHLGDDDTVWVGAGTRLDSPVGRALSRISSGDLQALEPDVAALARRISVPRASPEQVAERRERQAFADRLHASRLKVTPAVLAALVLVFALELFWGGLEAPTVLVKMGANTRASLHGEPWRLLASTFLHGSILHILFNGWALWVLGGFVERVLGPVRLLLLWVVAGACGSVFSAFVGAADLSVGASGALLGMLGAAALAALRPEGILPASVVPAIRRAALVNLALAASMSLMPRVDLWAHLGGALAGAATFLLMRPTLARSSPAAGPPPPSPSMRLCVALLVGLAIGSLLLAVAVGRPDLVMR